MSWSLDSSAGSALKRPLKTQVWASEPGSVSPKCAYGCVYIFPGKSVYHFHNILKRVPKFIHWTDFVPNTNRAWGLVLGVAMDSVCDVGVMGLGWGGKCVLVTGDPGSSSGSATLGFNTGSVTSFLEPQFPYLGKGHNSPHPSFLPPEFCDSGDRYHIGRVLRGLI